jgi:hypothetical protein
VVALRTEITEIVTGLAMLGYRSLDDALEIRPGHILNVGAEEFDRLAAARADGTHTAEFATAWANGSAFAISTEGLRGRPPWTIEWKGPHRPPGYEQIPADLRIDHVYLVSCKYGSAILHNAGPAHLLDRRLTDRGGERVDWFAAVAPEAHQALYAAYIDELGLEDMPVRVEDLQPGHRRRIKDASVRGLWPGRSAAPASDFALAAAQGSAERWHASLDTRARREEMVWRLLRLQAAPYFVLGADLAGGPLRYRVATPWDFRQAFDLRSFDVWPDAAGQPLVRWRIDVHDRTAGGDRFVAGHVEIRWSHGRFSGAPEAKVYLDTAPHDVAGYLPLDDAASGVERR